MPTDFQEASSSSSSSGYFSILSRRRDQAPFMESSHETSGPEMVLEAFQRQVAERFHDLAASGSDEVLSIPWLRKLLDAFLCCQDDFRVIVFDNKAHLHKPLMEKYISDFYERSVKALDVCNAIRDGIEQIRQWEKLLEIVLCALDNQRTIGESQFRRAKKALVDLAIGMLDEKDSSASSHSCRNRSFGQNNVQREQKSLAQFRSLSWSVSRTWSAVKQLQAISNNLVAPRNNEILSTNGLSMAVFIMSNVLFFITWALVAAIPCQDRGLQTHIAVTKQFFWAIPIISLYERVLEESKKRDLRNACGLLKEIDDIEICSWHLNELVDSVNFPLTEEKESEVKLRVKEVRVVHEAIKNELNPLEREVREVFHHIIRSRMEGLDLVGRANGHDR